MELLYKNGETVAAGDVLAEPYPVVSDELGELPDVSQKYLPSANAKLSDDESTIEATALGKVFIDKDRIGVVIPVQIAPDQMSASIEFFSVTDSGLDVTTQFLHHALEQAGVSYGIDSGALDAGLAYAEKEATSIFRQVVANGKPAIDGRDAELRFQFETEKKVGTARHGDGIDFRERDMIVECNKDDLICEKIPATSGEVGTDVLGNKLTPKAGSDTIIKAGKNIRVSDDGDHFYAEINGVVKNLRGSLEVHDVAVVDGDVNFESGNIRTDDCAAHIRGIVKKGFVVEAASHITVEKSAEDAVLKSGGNILIHRGILHSSEGLVYAAGGVKASFAQNASIEAGEDIILKSALNCNLRTAGRVIITEGKGRLVGGLTKAHQGIEVRDLGAESEAATLVFVGSSAPDADLLERQIWQAQQKFSQLNASLGVEQMSAHRTSLPPDNAARRAVLEQEREEISDTLNMLIQRKEDLLYGARSLNRARIIVHRTVFPGVVAHVYGFRYVVTKPMHHCVFCYDPGYERVACIPVDDKKPSK